MLCPICQETLQMSERQGVEIDYCPKCRGVWLDRGELQKLIDFSISQVEMTSNRGNQPAEREADPLDYPKRHEAPDYEEYRTGRGYDSRPNDERRYDERRYEERKYDSYAGYGKPKKRESWFSELFDWD